MAKAATLLKTPAWSLQARVSLQMPSWGFRIFKSDNKPQNTTTAMDSSLPQIISQIWNIADDVLRRMRCSDDSIYREYNQNEDFQGNFRNLLRQIIDDQDYREVVDQSDDL